MEGPSLVIAREDLKPFLRKEVTGSSGSLEPLATALLGKKLSKVSTWGKLLWLHFPGALVRVHFLMFGSYRINDPREGRVPKLQLEFGGDTVYFYSCSAKLADAAEWKALDEEADLMSPDWNGRKALKKLQARGEAMVSDLLMDQTIFAGLGNIMKNEILFRCLVHPESRFARLSAPSQSCLVRDSRAYALQFYAWKKQNVLKRNWKVMRKKKCPTCGGRITKRATGKLERLSHYCGKCQKLAKP